MFSDYADKESSQKILLAKVEAATRESSFSVFSGSTYSKPFDKSPVISAVEEEGVAYVLGTSSVTLTAGQYYYDIKDGVLYVRTFGSDDPNSHFIAVSFFLFFSNRPLSLSYDLGSGFDVSWCPILKSDSTFGVTLDNKDTNLGNAIEGSGTLSFVNDLNFWPPIFDKYTFENRRAFVYQYNIGLDASEARLIYKGLVQTKNYTNTSVSFGLKDLFNAFRNEIPLAALPDFEYSHRILGTINARITESETERKQRLVYGRPNGVQLQNVDSAINFPAVGSWNVIAGSSIITNANADPNPDTDFFNAGDEIELSNNPGKTYTIKFIDKAPVNNTIETTEPFEGSTQSGVTITVTKPVVLTQQYQRYWLVSGHPLSEISTTVTVSFTARLFRVSDVTGMKVGDNITVDGVESRNITMISPVTNQIEVDLSFSFLPAVGMSVLRSPVKRLFYNGTELEQNLHYTVDAANGLVELDSSIENNPEFFLSTNDINGIGEVDHSGPGSAKFKPYTDATDLSGQIEIGDWVFLSGDDAWRQVWQVEEDGYVHIRTPLGAGVSTPDTFIIRRPTYQENPIISADVIGKTDDNTVTGIPLLTGPVIVRDLLENSGLGDDLLSSSFDDASDLSEHVLGLVIPSKLSATSVEVLRDSVNQVNRSIFGSLFQNENYLLEYSVLDPTRDESVQRLNRHDVLSFSIKSDSRSVVKRVDINYNNREIDNDSLSANNSVSSYTSDIGEYLVKTEKVKEVDTLLMDTISADIFASRWARILELGRSLVTLNMKLQTSERSISDRIEFTHPNLYQRFGSTLNKKIGSISSIVRGVGDTKVVFDDLGNAFSKKSSITVNDASDFDDATENELMLDGYITDNDGNVSSGLILTNLIW